MNNCGFAPYPGSGAYGHWRCQRRQFHLGRHRFINYTIPRVPRVWHIRALLRVFRADRRFRSLSHGKHGFGYRQTLFPAKYEPTRCNCELCAA